MYQSILVPLDGSVTAEAILPEIENLAKGMGARLIITRICPSLKVAEPTLAETLSSTSEHAEQYLTEMKSALNGKGIDVETHLGYGDAAYEIIDLSNRLDVDLIAMSTHGRSGIGRWLLGSIAEKVVRHSSRPVLLVRASAE
ncbi:MAG: universal stress protein [Desulfosarcinaceae bacterium]|jgi:nucleotide-binding universal stress UspA family protein